MEAAALKRALKRHGVSMPKDARARAHAFLESAGADQGEAALDDIAEQLLECIEDEGLTSCVVGDATVAAAVARFAREHAARGDAAADGKDAAAANGLAPEDAAAVASAHAFRVNPCGDAFSPDLENRAWDEVQGRFVRRARGMRRTLAPPASSRVATFRERFFLLRDRVRRNALFLKPALGHLVASRPALDADRASGGAMAVDGPDGGMSEDAAGGDGHGAHCELTEVAALLGRVHQVRVCLAMLYEDGDGRTFAEDLSGSVEVVGLGGHPNARCEAGAPGFFCERCVVLLEGAMQPNGTFRAIAVTFPPLPPPPLPGSEDEGGSQPHAMAGGGEGHASVHGEGRGGGMGGMGGSGLVPIAVPRGVLASMERARSSDMMVVVSNLCLVDAEGGLEGIPPAPPSSLSLLLLLLLLSRSGPPRETLPWIRAGGRRALPLRFGGTLFGLLPLPLLFPQRRKGREGRGWGWGVGVGGGEGAGKGCSHA